MKKQRSILRRIPYYAAAFVGEARDAARILGGQPQLGRMVPEVGDVGIRELIVRSYRLIYLIEKDQVYIIGFIHGARDLSALWKREGKSRRGDIG